MFYRETINSKTVGLLKYLVNDIGFLLRSLSYFDDAEKQNEQLMILKKQVKWKDMKTEIIDHINQYINNSINN